MFTREDTSSIPVPETKFNRPEGERLGQLVITPEVVASKINNMKENKSPGVGLPRWDSTKILKETVEQISTPLAHVFNMSLQEGIVDATFRMERSKHHFFIQKMFKKQVCKLWASEFNITYL